MDAGTESGATAQTFSELLDRVPTLNVAQLQEELSKRGLETKWTPLKGKKELVNRLTVGASLLLCMHECCVLVGIFGCQLHFGVIYAMNAVTVICHGSMQ